MNMQESQHEKRTEIAVETVMWRAEIISVDLRDIYRLTAIMLLAN